MWIPTGGVFVLLLTLVTDILSLDLCREESTTELESYIARNASSTECGCERTTCFRKCCKPGFFLRRKLCVRVNYSDLFRVPVYTKQTFLMGEVDNIEKFSVGALKCSFFLLNNSHPDERFYLQENGEMWVPMYNQFYSNDRYCLDADEENSPRTFLCFPDDDLQLARKFNVLGMIISMPFLLVTFLVYLVLPDSNIHRKALMFYVMSLLIAYICLVSVQLYKEKIEPPSCEALGLCVVYFFLVSFFWMNVMCIDIFLAFRGLRGFTGKKSAETKRFLLYCLYALGLPTLHVLLLLTLNRVLDEKSVYSPQIGVTKCFLEDGIPNLLYFYGPMGVLLTINIILFILTAIKIQQVKKETSMLKHSDSKRHSYENDKQKFNLYVKLLLAMGVNWIMEIISWAFIWKMGQEVPNSVWYLTDFVNAMYGVLIFFIFVFKRKIWKSLQKRLSWKDSTDTITTAISTPRNSANKVA